jgi:hypothetical protein
MIPSTTTPGFFSTVTKSPTFIDDLHTVTFSAEHPRGAVDRRKDDRWKARPFYTPEDRLADFNLIPPATLIVHDSSDLTFHIAGTFAIKILVAVEVKGPNAVANEGSEEFGLC